MRAYPGVLLFAAVAFWAGCSGASKEASSSKGQTKKTAAVERRNLDFSVEAIGDLRPSIQVDVKAEISGRVKKIIPGTGDTVKRGGILVELDDTDLLTERSSTLIEIEGAKLLLSKATLAAGRARQLAGSELISKQEADNTRLDAELAKNSLDKAVKKLQSVEDKLSKTRIAAPIQGTVIVLPIVEGQVVLGGPSVSTGTILMTLANLSEMIISTHINQLDVTRMREGQPVQVAVDAFEGMKLDGKIQFIAPVASIKNNIKGFSVDILVNRTDPRIRPGMSANVKIPISRVESALSIPIEAVFREGEKRVVYRKEGDRFIRTEVDVGVITSDHAEIKSGLKEGETVILTPPPQDGAKN